MVRVNPRRLELALDDGRRIEAGFQAEHEPVVLQALCEHSTARLQLRGEGQFTQSGELSGIERVDSAEVHPIREDPAWERIRRRVRAIPPAEAALLPTDGADEHDHYIYGTPRQSQ